MTTFIIERRKSKHAWVLFVVTVLLISLNAVNGTVNFLQHAEVFESNHVTWQAVWGQGGLLWTVLFLPFMIAMRAASLTRIEHEQANWQRLASYGAHLRAYQGKLLLLSGFVLTCQVVFAVVTVIASVALGFTLSATDVLTMLSWGMFGAVGGITIAAIQLTVGVIVRSFATTLAIGIIGAIGSLVVTLVAPPLEGVYPYAQPGVGMRVRSLDWLTMPETVGFLIWNLVLIVGAVLIGTLVLRRKEH